MQDDVRTEQTFQSPKCSDDGRNPWRSCREGARNMTMIRVEPVEVHVRTGWFDGSPREITWGDERLSVTRLNAVREEAAAYPVITGPRTLFDVETPRARLALTYQHRSRRWTITALDDDELRAAA
jgi:hypothetical protein